jgi:cytosine deaminase
LYPAGESENSLIVDLVVRNVRVEKCDPLQQIAVQAGKIVACGRQLDYTGVSEVDAGGRLILPGFVDSHVHLDIALVNDMQKPGRQILYTSQKEMMADMEARKKAFTKQDIIYRAETLLDMAVRHGVTAVRAQCHIDPEVGLHHLEALLEVKQRVVSRITLQIVAFPNQELLRADTLSLFENAFTMGADVMGCAPLHDEDRFRHMDVALELAAKYHVDLDVHADLTLPQVVDVDGLDVVTLARKILSGGYQGRVCAGHLSALDSLSQADASKVIDLIREANISVISLPDLYRLGRTDTQHVRRGLTRVKEMLQAGVNVCFASNNTRDCLRPYGNMNPLEEALILSYGAHMDEVGQLESLIQMATTNAARAIGLTSYGLNPGDNADFILLAASSPSAAIINQSEVSHVFKAGQLLVENQRTCIWHVPTHYPTMIL